MIRRIKGKLVSAACLALVICCFGSGELLAWGDMWRSPNLRFEFFSENKTFWYRKVIGSIPSNYGDEIPLFLVFTSERVKSRSLDTTGWTLPLLDASSVQIDPRTFLVTFPDGRSMAFERSDGDAALLRGSGGWEGAVSKGTLTVWHSSGTKVVYQGGWLSSFSFKDRKFTLHGSGNRIEELKENGSTVLKLSRGLDETIDLAFSGAERVKIRREQSPIVETIGTSNVVKEMGWGIGDLKMSDGQAFSVKYELDDARRPLVIVSGPSGFTVSWDPNTRMPVRVNEWTYSFENNRDPQSSWTVIRKNADGKTEKYSGSNSGGTSENVAPDGTKTALKIFRSGNLKGKIREYVVEAKDRRQLQVKLLYDESGRVIRRNELSSDGKEVATTYVYTGESLTETIVQNGSETIQFSFDKNGVPTEKINNNTQ